MGELLSVGIDIGTSTTNIVFSRLTLRDMASSFSVPRITIAGKEILYRSAPRLTPQTADDRLDPEALAALLKEEYRAAGVTPEMVKTGAVIVTGESSRRENAADVLQVLSRLAGKFVVAAAGPDMEAIIAAKGAGVPRYSKECGCTVTHFDIGGGTTNVARYRAGQLEGVGCWDVGGRLIRVAEGQITKISPRLAPVIQGLGLSLSEGTPVSMETLKRLVDGMAGLLCQAVGMAPQTPLCQALKTQSSTGTGADRPADWFSFSGGVAEYLYHPTSDWFRHGDIGPLLADAIRRSPLWREKKIYQARETIHATVIGAGCYTTAVSGSTIYYTDQGFLPIYNLPALIVSPQACECAVRGNSGLLQGEMRWFLRENTVNNVVLCLNHVQAPGYQQLCALAESLAAADVLLPTGTPLLALAGGDYAMALGRAIQRRLGERPVICIDGISVQEGDYLDLGVPEMGGLILPVVVKTLIFG